MAHHNLNPTAGGRTDGAITLIQHRNINCAPVSDIIYTRLARIRVVSDRQVATEPWGSAA